MTNVLDRSAVSVARPTFEGEGEGSMVATATYSQGTRRARPHGIDRAIMRMSLMTLLWARRHAERTAVSYPDHTRLHRQAQALQRREHDAALRVARVR